MDIIKTLSPHYNLRDKGVDPCIIVLHYTGTLAAKEAADTYLDVTSNLSPHYMVDVGGQVVQFVEEKHRAWHAGHSYWRGSEDVNSLSIGIEIVNGGHDQDLPSFPTLQIDAVIKLCHEIMGRYQIDPLNVVGHSDVAPGRKLDPGELFPWELLSKKGVGFWPVPLPEDFACNLGVRTGLLQLGYTQTCEDIVLVREFQRHFEPELFEKNKQGQVSERTHALIACLLREKNRKTV